MPYLFSELFDVFADVLELFEEVGHLLYSLLLSLLLLLLLLTQLSRGLYPLWKGLDALLAPSGALRRPLLLLLGSSLAL